MTDTPASEAVPLAPVQARFVGEDNALAFAREVTFTTQEVARVAGVTYRQLDHWTRSGTLSASATRTFVGSRERPGSGSVRRFSVADLQRACVLAALVRAGVSLTAATRAMGRMRQVGPDAWEVPLSHQVTAEVWARSDRGVSRQRAAHANNGASDA